MRQAFTFFGIWVAAVLVFIDVWAAGYQATAIVAFFVTMISLMFIQSMILHRYYDRKYDRTRWRRRV